MIEEDQWLFDPSEIEIRPRKISFGGRKGGDTPIWTKNKAHFIARYLKTFTYITKHGTYIDAFAGPQHSESKEESWAAKLVMANQPAWIRKFFLFDKEKKQVEYLEKLKEDYLAKVEKPESRVVEVIKGDSNYELKNFFRENPIKPTEASFCLFDQRTAECNWDTVRFIAEHKSGLNVNKVEIFYFLCQAWLDRAASGWKNRDKRLLDWWGRDDGEEFLKLHSSEKGPALAERFCKEFGYKHAYSFPIQRDGLYGKEMFKMIHASDHDEAPTLMWRAYRHVEAGGGINEKLEQRTLAGFECKESGPE